MLTVDHAGIEMGNRHWRRTDRCLAVDLGVMPLVDLRIIAAQPDAADRKSAVTLSLRDAGFLQQRQCAAAGAEIDALARGRTHVAALGILHVEAQATARLGPKIVD